MRSRYIKYRNAIMAILNGSPIGAICLGAGISRRNVGKQIRRCLEMADDGRMFGFRALRLNSRTKKYSVKIIMGGGKLPRGFSGRFMALQERYPHIFERVLALYLKRNENVKIHESRIPILKLHMQFLGWLREAGVMPNEYPFVCRYASLRTMSAYLKKQWKSNMVQAVAARVGAKAARELHDGENRAPTDAPLKPYQRVYLDGHKIDAFFTIRVTSPTGIEVDVVLDRLWIIVVIDHGSRAILGYFLCLEKEYSSDDVLESMNRSIVPWKRRELTIPGLEYMDGAAFPSGLRPELAYATWTEAWLDGAKANLANAVRTAQTTTIGGDLNVGPPGMPERRYIIERFFRTLASSGFQRLPSTTGKNPADGRRNDPEDRALRFDIRLEEMEQVIDVLLANYNVTSHNSLFGRTPIEVLTSYVESGGTIVQVPEDKRESFSLSIGRYKRTVVGKPSNGKRPHIEFEGVTYHSSLLSKSPALCGERLTILVNKNDLRVVKAFRADGSDFGKLTANGYWGVTPHDLRTRKAIMKLKIRKLFTWLAGQDPIAAYMNYLESKAQGRKRERGRLAKLKRSMGAEAKDPRTPTTEVQMEPKTKGTKVKLPSLEVGQDTEVRAAIVL